MTTSIFEQPASDNDSFLFLALGIKRCLMITVLLYHIVSIIL